MSQQAVQESVQSATTGAIVVGTSLTETSDGVVATALELAQSSGASLCLVHAYPLPLVLGGGTFGEPAAAPPIAETEDMLRSQVAEQLRRVGGQGPEGAQIVLGLGSAHRLLAEVAEEVGAALVVLGASEAPPTLAPILGSTADRVLRKVACPVLVVRSQLSLPPRRVLVPVDLSPLSEALAQRGLAMLKQLGQEPDLAELLFVLSRVDREGSQQFTPEQIDRFATNELEQLRQRLSTATEASSELQCHLSLGLPKQEILARLEEHPADLVLMGTQGRSGFERFMLGSVAAEVIRGASASVLALPPASPAAGQHSSDESGIPEGARRMTLLWSEILGPGAG